MQLSGFIAQRDAYIQSEIFLELTRLTRSHPERSPTQEEYLAAIERAFEKGAEEWQGLLTKTTRDDLTHIDIGAYDEPARA